MIHRNGARFRLPLYQLGVEHDLGIVGEELGDGAASLGLLRGLVEGLLSGAGDSGGGWSARSW